MLTIIFGAGASYDALPDLPAHVAGREAHPARLPLADQLFENRGIFAEALRPFPQCRAIIPYLRQAGKSIEEELERLQAEAAGFPVRLRQLAAIRYYLQTAVSRCGDQWEAASNGITNYVTLLDQVEKYRPPDEPVLLVTFNYDRMLEQALHSQGVAIGWMQEYVQSPKYKVVKVHGSVNWGRQILGPMGNASGEESGTIAARNIEHAAVATVSKSYFVADGQPVARALAPAGQPFKPGEAPILFPAIAIPVQEKADFECPDDHLTVMEDCLRNTTKLLTIGWRGRERHFLKVLKEHLPAVRALVVAGGRPDAQATMIELVNGGVPGHIDTSPRNGFSDFVVSRDLYEFLKIP